MRRFGLLVSALTALLIPVSAHAQKLARGSPAPAWVKLCEKANAVSKDKDGNEEKKAVNICLTHHERLSNTGMVLVSAALRQIEGQDKQHFMVMVPLDMLIKPGLRVTIYPKDLWEKLQNNEKIDESKLNRATLDYTLCHPAGCTAELEATPALMSDLQTNGGIMVSATNSAGAPVTFVVPLVGFAEALTGPPALRQQPAQRPLVCAEAAWGKAEWRGCSMKPIQEWGR